MYTSCPLTAGSTAIIERKGRPWKLTRVEEVLPGRLRVSGGFEYCATTGERLSEQAAGVCERLVPVTPEQLAYLDIREFLKRNAVQDLARAKLDNASLLRLARLLREAGELIGGKHQARTLSD